MALVQMRSDLVFHVLIGITEGGWFCYFNTLGGFVLERNVFDE